MIEKDRVAIELLKSQMVQLEAENRTLRIKEREREKEMLEQVSVRGREEEAALLLSSMGTAGVKLTPEVQVRRFEAPP